MFLWIGIILEVLVFILCPGVSILSGISGILGVFSVVLCSQRKLSQFIFSFLQLFTYSWLVFQEKLWGELVENVFYFITMILGIYLWKSGSNKGKIITRGLGKIWGSLVFLGTIVGILVLWIILRKTNDSQPLLDSITTVPAFVAQILMMTRFRENWIYWLIIDLGSIIMWWNSGDYCMVTQFIYWSANCIYGWTLWRKP